MVLDEDGQVAHRAGRGGDPLGDLALDHEDGPLRPRRVPEQPVEDRARHVVGQVRDDVVRRREQRARSWSSASPSMRWSLPGAVGIGHGPRDLGGESRRGGRERVVELDRRHRRARGEQAAGQDAESRADLEDPPSRRRRGVGEDRVEDVDVGEEVLRQAVAGWRPASWSVRRTVSASRRGGRTTVGGRPPVGPVIAGRAAATASRRGRARPAPRPRSGGPRPRRSSPRCPCRGPAAAR